MGLKPTRPWRFAIGWPYARPLGPVIDGPRRQLATPSMTPPIDHMEKRREEKGEVGSEEKKGSRKRWKNYSRKSFLIGRRTREGPLARFLSNFLCKCKETADRLVSSLSIRAMTSVDSQ